MKIATWNVNSIRARLPRVLEWLDQARPDVFLVQETKVTAEMFPAEPFDERGYNIAAVGEASGRNGVAILAKSRIEDVVEHLPGDEEDLEARYVEALIENVRLAAVYVPNGTAVGSARFAFKLGFFERLRARLDDALNEDEPLVIGGDFNVAPAPIDVFDHDALDGTVCYHADERARFRALLYLGMYDAFRVVEPKTADAYSWWHYQGRSWKANEGLRIDHILLSAEATDRLDASAIDRETRGGKGASDHAPVWCALRD